MIDSMTIIRTGSCQIKSNRFSGLLIPTLRSIGHECSHMTYRTHIAQWYIVSCEGYPLNVKYAGTSDIQGGIYYYRSNIMFAEILSRPWISLTWPYSHNILRRGSKGRGSQGLQDPPHDKYLGITNHFWPPPLGYCIWGHFAGWQNYQM